PPPADNQAAMQKTTESGGEVIPGEYIVVFKDQWEGRINNNVAQEALQFVNDKISEFGVEEKNVKSRYEYALRGFAAKLTDKQIEAIKRNPNVDFVEKNRRFNGLEGVSSVSPTNLGKTTGAALMSQSTPWGINRVGGPLDGTGKKAWVLDTGIDLDHPDLIVDVGNSVSYVGGESADDLNGHGTHVAGILAAKNNSTDVVGVAAGATVVSVKVLDQNGDGTISDAIDGINYVAGKASSSHVVNMSLGATGISTSFDNAVQNTANSGIRIVIAAGNDADDANNYSPGRVENSNIWTISGYDSNDNWYTNSNYGNPPIEYAGPAVNVPSLDIGGGTINMTGTSMATPHIAGLLLTVPNKITADGYVSNDPDNTPDAIAAYTPVQVTVSGPTVRQSGEQGTWTANATDGTGSYSYQWYYRNTPTDPWTPSGPNSSSYSHTFYNTSGSLQSSGVKVEVTSGGETAEDDVTIGVQSEGCAPGEIFC
ncbi:MAG: S8 family serine peptidase, partial [Gracilimonas sp.]|nr:S8 family serine peptidase [Gracilimonas sp.]